MVAVAERKTWIVSTPLGDGKVIHQFPDGTLAVEFPWGGGKIFLPEEIRGIPRPERESYPTERDRAQRSHPDR